jgi:hypothetical protein
MSKKKYKVVWMLNSFDDKPKIYKHTAFEINCIDHDYENIHRKLKTLSTSNKMELLAVQIWNSVYKDMLLKKNLDLITIFLEEIIEFRLQLYDNNENLKSSWKGSSDVILLHVTVKEAEEWVKTQCSSLFLEACRLGNVDILNWLWNVSKFSQKEIVTVLDDIGGSIDILIANMCLVNNHEAAESILNRLDKSRLPLTVSSLYRLILELCELPNYGKPIRKILKLLNLQLIKSRFVFIDQRQELLKKAKYYNNIAMIKWIYSFLFRRSNSR